MDTDTIVKSVLRFQKSICDMYLYLYLFKGTLRLKTGVGELWGKERYTSLKIFLHLCTNRLKEVSKIV